MTADDRNELDPPAGAGWLDPATLTRLAHERMVLIDVRPVDAFAVGHPSGARCVPHDPHRLAERVATVAPRDCEITIVADAQALARQAIRQLEDKGWSVIGAIDAALWRAAGRAWASLPELRAADLVGGFDGTVLDVREPEEWLTGCVPGAARIPLGELTDRLVEVPREVPVAVVCESGLRSATAASALQATGWQAANVTDGMAGYRRAGPLEHPVGVDDLDG